MKAASNTDSKSVVNDLLDERNFVGLLICAMVGSGLVGLVTHLLSLPAWISMVATVAFVLVSPIVLRCFRGASEAQSQPPLKLDGLVLAVPATVIVIVGWLVMALNVGSSDRVIMTDASASASTQLSDGTVLSLGARSTVRVNETEQPRGAYIDAGEVVLAVKMDVTKPFVVKTYSANVITPGAKFRVAVDSSVEIQVYEGVVQVVPPEVTEGESHGVTLRKGSPIYRVPDKAARAMAANSSGSVTQSLVGG